MLQPVTLRGVVTTPETAFGHVVRELRLERDLSQEGLSFVCGRHRTYVSLLERGQSSPTLGTLWMVADALEVPASEIVRRIEDRLAGA